MKIDVRIYPTDSESIVRLLHQLIGKVNIVSAELDRLTSEVAETNTVIDSAILLIQGIKAQLDAAIAANDPALLTALSDSLDSQQQALAAAIAANTPGS
jgi:hypothetical protein